VPFDFNYFRRHLLLLYTKKKPPSSCIECLDSRLALYCVLSFAIAVGTSSAAGAEKYSRIRRIQDTKLTIDIRRALPYLHAFVLLLYGCTARIFVMQDAAHNLHGLIG
jgi:hypothetical protein